MTRAVRVVSLKDSLKQRLQIMQQQVNSQKTPSFSTQSGQTSLNMHFQEKTFTNSGEAQYPFAKTWNYNFMMFIR